MPTLKAMLDCYKGLNKDFRAEYDGEHWKVWIEKDNNTGGYPDYQGFTNDTLYTFLLSRLRGEADEKKNRAQALLDLAREIYAVIIS